MQKWEYLVQVLSTTCYPNINKIGVLGWELITVIILPKLKDIQYYKFYFKREISDSIAKDLPNKGKKGNKPREKK